MNDQELEALYGPLAPYSEHQRGDRITFNENGQVYTGAIIWVCYLHEIVELSRPIKHVELAKQAHYINYIVSTDQQGGFPCVVWPGDVIVEG